MRIENSNICLLIGSSKEVSSTSAVLGEIFTNILKQKNANIHTVYIKSLEDVNNSSAFDQVLSSDLIVLSTPLYVDSLPAPVILAMDNIKEYREITNFKEIKNLFFGIVNSGFPEPDNCTVALKNLEEFAAETGFIFAGSIPVGGGAIIAKAGIKRLESSKAISDIGLYFNQIINEIIEKDIASESLLLSIATSIIPDHMQLVMYHHINRMCAT